MGYRDLTNERLEYRMWLMTPPTERIPRTKTALAKQLGIEKQTLHAWDKELKNYTSKEFFLLRKQDVDEGILAGVKRGNAQMAKLAKQISGEITDKPEVNVKVEINADYIEARRKEGEERARREVERIRSVQGEPALLPDKICEN